MKYKKKCPVCGRHFITNRELNLYCSPECQTAARRKRDREYKRTKRATGTAERRQVREERARVRTERADAMRKAVQDDFARRCAAGDVRALLIREKATNGNWSRRYWKLFALASIEEAEISGTTSRTTVNGYSVYDDTFPDEVMESMKERGQVYIELSRR